jgi:hypothetical protein
MYINFEEIRQNKGIIGEYVVNSDGYCFSNPLVKSVFDINCDYEMKIVGSQDLDLHINVKYKINYLDSTNLELIILSRNFEEEVCFTVNEKRAEELDIDCISGDVNLDDLILALINVDIPFNYSNEKIKTSKIDSESYNPFSNIF